MTLPLPQSSGDLIADRRCAIAQELSTRGDLAGAADLLVQAIEAAPRFVSAWFTLGQIREKLGRHDDAIAAFQQVCALDPEDRLGAGLHLVRLGALPPGDMPAAYVRALFDQFAPRFETTLNEGLGYRGPQLLRDAVAAACTAEGRARRFAAMLDLGCGTGLAGAVFRPMVRELIGVDLSARMIERARAKNIYDRLVLGDLAQFMHGEARDRRRYELIVAADVFIYLAWLPSVIAAAAGVLAPGGLIAFTVETHVGDDVILGAKLRYQHGIAHVQAAIAGAGLKMLGLSEAWARQEAGAEAPGLVVVARL
ncbi:MAG TPA: methyltransferase domain-containing protein [Xanthobacteraceae bacterium]|nr:methyltransferase domain-containing protein [Xanthobacteraceae bacterium]